MPQMNMIQALNSAHDIMLAWDVESDYGTRTQDPHVRIVPIGEALEETKCVIAGTSPVVQYRVEMLRKVEDLLLL